MKRTGWMMAALMATSLAGTPAWGQEKPREPRDGRGGAPEQRRDGDRPRDHHGREGEEPNRPQRPEERRGEIGRPGDPNRARPQPGVPGQNQVEFMRNYLGMVDHYTRMAKDPSSAAIAAVVTAGDLLRPRGADKAIEYFTKLLPEVKDKAVERAVRLQLVELHKMSGQHDQALEQLRAMIVAAPEGEKRASNDLE